MRISAYAKINLTLDITGKLDNGYHTLDTVMQTISLCDEIDLSKNKDGKIVLSSSKVGLPLDNNNTAFRAASFFLERAGIADMGVNIHIMKNIPSEAGLGGGSADAAAVLLGMNELFRASVPKRELLQMAARVGADVPFCLAGGTRRCMGIGEILSTLPPLPPCFILICKPPVGIKTPEAYAESDKYPQDGYFMTPYMADALRAGELAQIAENLGNRFDDILHVPEVQIIKGLMLEYGALGTSMTGSGSAVFGIFESGERAKNAVECLKDVGKTFIAEPVNL